jgi:site-specific DNA-cytosine methylase
MIRVLDLFSGIGGFALASQWVGGFATLAFCEIEDYCRKVLAKNFPDIPIFTDVRELHPTDVIPRDGSHPPHHSRFPMYRPQYRRKAGRHPCRQVRSLLPDPQTQ